MQTTILAIFTRTPLHIGAGSSVGAIDQPVVRERHTRFPIIPGTSLKGVIADLWPATATGKRDGGDATWLFGSETATAAAAGALLFGEGKLLAFPIRSAKGAFAWITCPLTLARFARDSGNSSLKIPCDLKGEECCAPASLCLSDKKVILEEYVIAAKAEPDAAIVQALTSLSDDIVWQQLKDKLVILSDEMFAYFAENACETAQHIRIDDQTGTVAKGALFNQENVPSETLFYSVVNAQAGKGSGNGKTPGEAMAALKQQLAAGLIQIGADETTGLGWCSVSMKEVK